MTGMVIMIRMRKRFEKAYRKLSTKAQIGFFYPKKKKNYRNRCFL